MDNKCKDNYEFFISVVKSLASSQGFYDRLLRKIYENGEDGIKHYINTQAPKFKDPVDVVMFLEN